MRWSITGAGALLFCLIGAGVPRAADDCQHSRIAGLDRGYLLLAEGDSITFGQQSTDGQGSYVQRTCVLRANPIETIDMATSRATLGSRNDPPGRNSLYGRLASDAAILQTKKAGRVAILSVLIGRNDLVGYIGGPSAYAEDIARYIAEMRGAGIDKVIVGTLLPSTWDAFTAPRDALNAIITSPGWAKANGVDAVAHFAASPTMGDDDAAANKTLFADGIHPTNKGYAALAPIYGAAVRDVILQAEAHR